MRGDAGATSEAVRSTPVNTHLVLVGRLTRETQSGLSSAQRPFQVPSRAEAGWIMPALSQVRKRCLSPFLLRFPLEESTLLLNGKDITKVRK